MDADVTVLPVPGGPWISPRGRCNTVRMACIWELFSLGRLGADSLQWVKGRHTWMVINLGLWIGREMGKD